MVINVLFTSILLCLEFSQPYTAYSHLGDTFTRRETVGQLDSPCVCVSVSVSAVGLSICLSVCLSVGQSAGPSV